MAQPIIFNNTELFFFTISTDNVSLFGKQAHVALDFCIYYLHFGWHRSRKCNEAVSRKEVFFYVKSVLYPDKSSAAIQNSPNVR